MNPEAEVQVETVVDTESGWNWEAGSSGAGRHTGICRSLGSKLPAAHTARPTQCHVHREKAVLN